MIFMTIRMKNKKKQHFSGRGSSSSKNDGINVLIDFFPKVSEKIPNKNIQLL
jgi:hypothetical protein